MCASSAPPVSKLTAFRPNDPPSTSIDVPGLSFPFFVLTTSAPPRVLSPKIGLDPGRTLTLDTAFMGMRSQFTIEPKGSFIRTPSK